MKRIYLPLFFLFFANIALGSNWAPITPNGTMFVDLDVKNIKRTGSKVLIWQKMIYPPEDKAVINGKKVTESENQVSIDCANNTYQLIKGIYYSNSEALETTTFPTTPDSIERIEPNTVIFTTKELTCLPSQLSKDKTGKSAITQKNASKIYLECTYQVGKEAKVIEQVIDLNVSTINGRPALISDSEISWEGDNKLTRATISRQTGVSQIITLVDQPSFKAGQVTISGKCQPKTQKLF